MYQRYFGTITAVILCGTLGLTLWSVYSVFVLDQKVYAENGLLENTQAIILVIASIVFFAPIVFDKRSDKLILGFFSLLCLTFVLRELDVEKFNVPYALKFIGSGVGRNTMLATAFIGIFLYAAFRFSYYKTAAIRFLRTRAGPLLIAGGVLLFVGEYFDKHSAIAYHAYFEELSELFGYILMLLAAFAS